MPSKLLPSLSRLFAVTNYLNTRAANHSINTRSREELYASLVATSTEAWHARLPPAYSTRAGVTTLQLEHGVSASLENVNAQAQSSLFGKLPREIRDMIYEYALSSETFMVRVPEPFAGDASQGPFKLVPREKAVELFALPWSCKLAYIEAKHYIYENNTFVFPDVTSYFVFQRLTPSYLLHTITTLTMRWNYYHNTLSFTYGDGFAPDNIDFWISVCHAISRMKGLKYVRVDMMTNTPYVDAPDEDMMFGPIRLLRRVNKVEVFCKWDLDLSLLSVQREWPFRIERSVKELSELWWAEWRRNNPE